MKRIYLYSLIASTTIVLTSPVFAMSCKYFNSIGEARSANEFLSTNSTEQQFIKFRYVIANHAADINSASGFPKRKKALHLIRDADKLTWFLRESLALTRDECLRSPNKNMDSVAVNEFNFLLDAVATNF